MDIDIIFENDDFLAVNKPAGVLVHHTAKSRADSGDLHDKKPLEEDTLSDWLLGFYPEVAGVGDVPEERPGIVHRLDKDTSGIMLIPRNQEYFLYLKNLFQEGKIKKAYRAITYGRMENESGVIDKPISLKTGTVKRTVFKGKMTKPAVTEYKVIRNFEDSAYLEVYPKTGRTHQVRVHLASIGHPILGDELYGSKNSRRVSVPGLTRHMLHAYSLEFEYKKGEIMSLTVDIPEDFESVLQYLEKASKLHWQ